MNNFTISVIIPVYNCEMYLQQSIESLLNQTIFDKIEFIFIDDGSTDDSYAILKKYSNLYENFLVLHQDNRGVSVARNLGLRKAKGEYISFFDADDVAKPQLYEKLYNLILEYKADISIVDYSMIFNDGTIKKHRRSIKKEWIDSQSAIKDFLSTNIICNNPIDKMIKASIAKEVLFPEGYAVGEDMYYLYNVLKKSKHIVIDSTESLYNYLMHSTSVMKQKFTKKHIHAVKLSKLIVDDCRDINELYSYAYANYIHEICKMLELMYRSHCNEEYTEITEMYLKELSRYKILNARSYMSKKHFIGFILMRTSPSLYCLVYKILKIG